MYLDDITIAGKTEEELNENVGKFLAVAERRSLTLNLLKTVSCTTELNVLGYNISQGQIKPDPES